MNAASNKNEVKNLSYWLKLAGTATTVLVSIIISMTGFWMMIGKDYVTRDETRIIISNELAKVDISLKNHSDILKKIDTTIEKNTNTITDLKLSLSALASLDALEKRMSFLESELKSVREEQIKRTGAIMTVNELETEIKQLKEKIILLDKTISRIVP